MRFPINLTLFARFKILAKECASDGGTVFPSTHCPTVLYWRLSDFRMLGCHLHAKQGLMWTISVWHVSLNLLSHLDNCTIFTAWVSRFFSLFFPVTYWLFPKEFIFRLRSNVLLCSPWVSWFFSLSFFWPVMMNVKRKIIRFSKRVYFETPIHLLSCVNGKTQVWFKLTYRESAKSCVKYFNDLPGFHKKITLLFFGQ